MMRQTMAVHWIFIYNLYNSLVPLLPCLRFSKIAGIRHAADITPLTQRKLINILPLVPGPMEVS